MVSYIARSNQGAVCCSTNLIWQNQAKIHKCRREGFQSQTSNMIHRQPTPLETPFEVSTGSTYR
jgi:hypothetical protein